MRYGVPGYQIAVALGNEKPDRLKVGWFVEERVVI